MSDSDERPATSKDGLTRKQLLGTGAGAAAAALLAQGAGVERALGAGKGGRQDVAGMNIVLILTDQERAIQHFPPNWLRQNLPGMRRLRQHGVSFERAFTNACMCSPARSTLMSGFFPAQHGVKYTLEEDMPFPEYPHQVELPRPPEMPNLATVMRAAGYNVVYKGKWHCSKPAEKENAKPSDLERYGFTRWNPPDAGANQSVPEAGGGFVDNDGRFMESTGSPEAGSEGVMQYLSSAAAKQQPFFLVISLVNPHDVLFYPSKTFEEAGYDDSWIQGDIDVPATNEEDLSTKPSVQEQFLRIFNLTGKPKSEKEKRAYLNYLRQPDALLRQLHRQRPEQTRRDRSLRRHADRPHRRPRRDGPDPRRHAAEELQLLRGGDAGSARLLEPEAVPEAAEHRRAGLPRRLPADPGQPREGAEIGPRRLAGGGLLEAGPAAEDAPSRSRTTSSSPTTTSSPARRNRPTRNRRTTSSRSAKGAGSWPATTTSARKTRSRRSGRCTT